MKLFLLLLFLINLTPSAKEPKPQYFVDAKGGLHLREKPSEKSKSILLIPDKSEIQIIKEVSALNEINEKSGYWMEVIFQNKKGFVFSAYTRKYFLLDKKYSPDKNKFYEYYTPEGNRDTPCTYHEIGSSEKRCFLKIYNSKNKKLLNLLNYYSSSTEGIENKIWFEAKDWYDNKSFLIIDTVCDGGYCFTDIGYLNIHSLKYFSFLKNQTGECNNRSKIVIEQVEFDRISYYKIDSENSKIQTRYFTMLKPKADDFDKLLETCKRDPKNSVLVKPTTIVRKNYTFKINSKRAALYFKGKDILKTE